MQDIGRHARSRYSNAMNARADVQAALNEFAKLPNGKTAYRIYAYGINFRSNADTVLFCASSFKVFVLAAYLHYAELGELPGQKDEGIAHVKLEAALEEVLTVGAADQTQGSKVFEHLTGTTTALALLEAMIAHSDNTATDILMKHVGVDKVRSFMRDQAGLDERSVRIPDSTKSFVEYLDSSPSTTLINDKQTMTCTADAFADFYFDALVGKHFRAEETVRQFMRILSMADAIPHVVPAHTVCYMKGGSADHNGQHAMALAGELVVNASIDVKPPASFALLYNWTGSANWNTGLAAYVEASRIVLTALARYFEQPG